MPRNTTWYNTDGLVVGFGTHSVDNLVPAVTSEMGAVKTMQMLITGTELELTTITTSTFRKQVQNAVIKRGSKILSASLTVLEAFAGSSSTLTIGTYNVSSAAAVAADDADGIDAAIALTAIDAIGETVNCDGALVGTAGTYDATSAASKCGATSDSDVVIAAFAGTAAFTAGKAVLTVQYIEPNLYSGDSPAF